MSKTDVGDESAMRILSAQLLFHDNGYETIRELLKSENFAGVSLKKSGKIYEVEGKTKPEYQHFSRKYVAAFPGSLSSELEEKVDDLALITKWLGEGFALFLVLYPNCVRAWRYKET
jgi:hypothetical protein